MAAVWRRLRRNEDDVPLQIQQLILLSKITGDAQSAQEALELATYSNDTPLKLQAAFAYALVLYPNSSAIPYFERSLEIDDIKIHTLSLVYLYKLTGNGTYLT